jgi:hypothetical protein
MAQELWGRIFIPYFAHIFRTVFFSPQASLPENEEISAPPPISLMIVDW